MKRQSICIAFLALLILSCNSKKADNKVATDDQKMNTTEKTTGNSSLHNIISFKVDGSEVNSSGWNISRFNFGNGSGNCVNITSNMHEEPKTINVNINGDKPGVYPFQSGLGTVKTAGVAYGSYSPDYMKQVGNHFSFKEGEFEIISIDTVVGSFNARFHGTAKNMKGESVTITDGQVIDGKLRPGITGQGQ